MSFIKRAVRSVAVRFLLLIGRMLPLNQRKILFSSYYGRGFGDNPKYIANALLKSGKKLKLYWVIGNEYEKDTLPKNITPVFKHSFWYFYHYITAKVWVDNCRSAFPYKKKGQYYIQTWHGFALKRIEGDVEDKLSETYVNNAKKDSASIDLIVSEAEFMSEIYRRAFWYSGEISLWGSPRNDIFFDKATVQSIRKKVFQAFRLSSQKKIVLYAPTFRSDRSLTPYQLDYKQVVKVCQERFGGEFVAFARLHPNVMERSKELNLEEQEVVDASGYSDMQELLAAADVVISDYSSLMFDFSLSGKPCFMFATDIEDYKMDRNFYFRLEELPFSVGDDNDSLAKNILSFDEQHYESVLKAFWHQTGMDREGMSSDKCSEHILKICNVK